MHCLGLLLVFLVQGIDFDCCLQSRGGHFRASIHCCHADREHREDPDSPHSVSGPKHALPFKVYFLLLFIFFRLSLYVLVSVFVFVFVSVSNELIATS